MSPVSHLLDEPEVEEFEAEEPPEAVGLGLPLGDLIDQLPQRLGTEVAASRDGYPRRHVSVDVDPRALL